MAILLIIVSSIAIIEYPQFSTPKSEVSTTTSTLTVIRTVTTALSGYGSYNAAGPVDRNGLQLSADIEPVDIAAGQNFTVLGVLKNTLSSNVTVAMGELTNQYSSPCGSNAIIVSIYQDTNGSSYLPQPVPLYLYDPGGIFSCPAMFSSQYTFGPHQSVNSTTVISGYWAQSSQHQYEFRPLQAGRYHAVVTEYTLDEIYLYFEVI